MSLCYEFISRETQKRISVAEADDILCAFYGFEPDPFNTHPVLFHVIINIDAVREGRSEIPALSQKMIRQINKMFVVNVWRGH